MPEHEKPKRPICASDWPSVLIATGRWPAGDRHDSGTGCQANHPHAPAWARARINGPKVFGVRPGSPLLFKIPASGERPLRYGAKGLPAGLIVDAATGQVSGRLEHQGTHDVVFEVSNTHGTASRPFRIVCGETLALTPHMGWNSWYVWENNVTDKIIRDAADAIVRSGMIDHGYTYVNIDDCWAVKPGARNRSWGARRATRKERLTPTAGSPT